MTQANRHSETVHSSGANAHAPLTLTGFVLILAGLMSVNALATDIMLPAFPDISRQFGEVSNGDLQWVITAYMLGFGVSQLFMGFLADRYGRRPLLIVGLAVYVLMAVAIAFAPTYAFLVVSRFIQGIAAGAPRVIAGAAVRDCYSGREMAKVMSLVMTVFMAIPVFAPLIGQIILLGASWRWIFGALALFASFLLVVSASRFPETLPVERRRAISPAAIRAALASIFSSRQTMGYTVGAGIYFGSLFGMIGTAQPLLGEALGLGKWFTLAFSLMALSLSATSFINSRIVERHGMRRISHVANIGFLVNSLAMLAITLSGAMTAWIFVPMMSINMLLTGLVFGNFNALAMEPQGHIAGVAASFVSAISVIIGASIGFAVGSAYDGTAVPLTAAFSICSALSLLLILWTERGKLFGTSK